MPAAADPRQERRLVPTVLAEVMALLLAPVAAVALLGVRLWAEAQTVDPTFYTAFVQHGPDLLARFGEDNYYWTRLASVLPARALHLLLGPEAGYLLFRYILVLLALVPAYVLLRRWGGRSAGAVGVGVVLTNLVLLTAWGTDYPDAAGMSYLLGGYAALAVTSERAHVRVLWSATAGVLLGSAVLCNISNALLVGIAGLAYGLVTMRHGWLRLLERALVVLGVMPMVYLSATAASERALGASDIVEPTQKAWEFVSRPEELAKFHSENPEWILQATQLLVPIAVIGGLVLLARRSAPRLDMLERFVWWTLAGQFVALVYWQFGRTGSTLENYFYVSTLWPAVVLASAFLLVRLSRAFELPAFAPLLGLLLAAVLTRVVPDVSMDVLPGGLVVLAIVLAACWLAARQPVPASVGRRAARTGGRLPWLGAVVLLVVVCGLQLLVAARPQLTSFIAGQAVQPQVDYGDALGGDDRPYDIWRVSTDTAAFVWNEVGDGQIVTWWPPTSDEGLSKATSMLLWWRASLGSEMPKLSPAGVQLLEDRAPRYAVLYSEDGSEIPDAVQELRRVGAAPGDRRCDVAASGDVSVHVCIVELHLQLR